MINKKQIALIHVAANQLRLQRDDYVSILKTHAGVESAKDLDDFGFDKVLRFFVKMGFKKKRATRRVAPTDFANDGQRKVIYHLMEDLGWWPARLLGFVKKMTGKERVEELSGKEAQRVIEGLKAMRNRHVRWS